jgi:hypothetical protein
LAEANPAKPDIGAAEAPKAPAASTAAVAKPKSWRVILSSMDSAVCLATNGSSRKFHESERPLSPNGAGFLGLSDGERCQDGCPGFGIDHASLILSSNTLSTSQRGVSLRKQLLEPWHDWAGQLFPASDVSWLRYNFKRGTTGVLDPGRC